MKYVNKIINTILYMKKHSSFEQKWIKSELLFNIIDDTAPYITDELKTAIAIEVSEILAKEYDIYGYD